jgi:hypothetical protein
MGLGIIYVWVLRTKKTIGLVQSKFFESKNNPTVFNVNSDNNIKK